MTEQTKTTMDDFFTSDKAEEGRKLPLYAPSGEKTEHWLIVRGIDSDTFKRAEAKAKREGAKLAELETEAERHEKIRELQRRSVASLISAWSFDLEFTEKNVINFLKKAPQIEEAVNSFSARRTLFFAKESKTSTSGSK